MGLENFMNLNESAQEIILGGMMGGLFAGLVVLMIFVFAGIYVYHALAWQTIARRQKHKHPWLAWIPFANVSMILQMGRFGWGWIFLFLIPILGWIALWVLSIIAYWRIFEKDNYPGWLGLAPILPKVGSILYLVIIGVIAWAKPRKKSKR